MSWYHGQNGPSISDLEPHPHAKLMLRCTITGTLEPLRNLTCLTFLDVQSNNLGGMLIFEAVWVLVVVLKCGCQRGWGWGWGITATRTHAVAWENRIAWSCCADGCGDSRGVDVGAACAAMGECCFHQDM